VVINEPKPYLNHNVYVTRYAKYKSGGPKQNVIRDSQDAKYYSVKGHPHHAEGNGNNNNGNFKSNGNNNNHDNSKPAGNGNNNNNIKPTGNGNHDVKPSQNNQVQKQNQPAKSGGGGNNGSNKKH
jgi:hypothetical protein